MVVPIFAACAASKSIPLGIDGIQFTLYPVAEPLKTNVGLLTEEPSQYSSDKSELFVASIISEGLIVIIVVDVTVSQRLLEELISNE